MTSNTSTSKDTDHIPEEIPTKEGSYTMAEVNILLLERKKLISSPTTISDLKKEIDNLKEDIVRLKKKNLVIEIRQDAIQTRQHLEDVSEPSTSIEGENNSTEVFCICYKIYYKLLHTLNPMCKVIDFKNETILIETNFDKSKVITRRPIKWEEIDFPQEWVIENATQPRNNINTDISEIEQLNDGTVKIRFSEPTSMQIDNYSMSSRITRSNSSYISHVDYIVQIPSRASTSQIRETYRCENIKIDKDNIARLINKNDNIVNFNAFSKLFENDTTLVTAQHVNVMIKQNNYANIYMSILGDHIISLHDKVDKIIFLLPTKNKSKEKIAHSSLLPSPEIKDFKNKDYSDLENFLEKKIQRVMELPECHSTHWKSKFIDGLPTPFAESVRKAIRGENHSINYVDYTYGKLISACVQKGLSLCNQN
ncbi:hypothetical protein H5410_057122 [Solanum commersonii]|uniref:Uncharacterized protein n=1 Tax=Solanum commersonii TaxID=4109 RepID=A0A9J5WP81_SOLCO|nr:hypothetical protein H5410_057122 [Solanum commersonii]